MNAPIYLDHHATTPVDPAVLAAMTPFFSERFGNASSRAHRFGWDAQEAVDDARAHVAALVGAAPKAVVFTSGATESINTALVGCHLRSLQEAGRPAPHFITAQTEHSATLDTLARLERAGARVTRLAPNADGHIPLDRIAAALGAATVMVTLSFVNNEIGTVLDVAAVGALCAEHGVLFHCDAVQGVSTRALDVATDRIDLLSLSAHKMYGPKGVGALVVRGGVELSPLMTGGGHERGRRAGTLNVPGIVGLGAAAKLAAARRDGDHALLSARRDRLLARLQAVLGVQVHGTLTARVANNLNVAIDGVEAERLLLKLAPHVALSTGSACASHQGGPSHVLAALGVSAEKAHRSVRIGLGRGNDDDDVDAAAEFIIDAALALRDEH